MRNFLAGVICLEPRQVNESADTLSIASQAGFRCFTEIEDFKRYVQRDILALELAS